MCTLLIGRDVVAPGIVLLAANRDEDPNRPSDPPGVLSENPRVVGGRDRVAGGTWLAVRGREAAVAMLNRAGGAAAAAEPRRSRGLLALETARVARDLAAGIDAEADRVRDRIGDDSLLSSSAQHFAGLAVAEASYAPFSMVFASPAACWLLSLGPAVGGRPGRLDLRGIERGWHAITHRELDDRAEPRTARMLDALQGFAPGSLDEAIERTTALLRVHDPPAACLHEGRMVTVSSAVVWLARKEARYLHAEGRPCERPYVDYTHLLT